MVHLIVLDLTVSQLTVTLLLFLLLEYYASLCYMHLLLIIYPFLILITMIHVSYKLLEIYNNILFLLNTELQNYTVNIKRVYSDILSYSTMLNRLNQINKYNKEIRNNNKNNCNNKNRVNFNNKNDNSHMSMMILQSN